VSNSIFSSDAFLRHIHTWA